MKFLRFFTRLPARIAILVLRAYMASDRDLADHWRAAIRSVCIPAMNTRTTGDEFTHRLMKRLFGVERPKP
jgi:hypothetical protein